MDQSISTTRRIQFQAMRRLTASMTVPAGTMCYGSRERRDQVLSGAESSGLGGSLGRLTTNVSCPRTLIVRAGPEDCPLEPLLIWGPHRLGSVALTPPVVELVGELLRDGIVAGLAVIVRHDGRSPFRALRPVRQVFPLSSCGSSLHKNGFVLLSVVWTSRNHTHQTVQKISLDKISHALWRIRESQA